MNNKSKRNLSFLLIFLSFLAIAQGKDASGDIVNKTVSIEQGYGIFIEKNKDSDFIIIDVRTEKEFKTGHVTGAINVDIYDREFDKKINKFDKNKVYLIYCRSGHRSAQALEVMRRLGFKEVYNMGAFIEWQAKGYPVAK